MTEPASQVGQLVRCLPRSSAEINHEARRIGHASITTRLGAAQLAASGAILTKLVDGWLDDLERILGSIVGEVDPRFVEGVLVEVNRS